MAYLVGNLLGRFIFSFLLVLIVMFFLKRFEFKEAFSAALKPIPLLMTVIIFSLGIVGSQA